MEKHEFVPKLFARLFCDHVDGDHVCGKAESDPIHTPAQSEHPTSEPERVSDAEIDALRDYMECGQFAFERMVRELRGLRTQLAEVEDWLPDASGPYQTLGERTKLLRDQG